MSTVYSLPVSQRGGGGGGGPGIRRRLSSVSLNLKIKPPSSFSSYSSSIREWWGWGWDWTLSRKPTFFATDLEMNEDEIAAIGTHNRGSWRHVFFKLTSLLRRKLLGSDNVGLPQTYHSFNYYSSK